LGRISTTVSNVVTCSVYNTGTNKDLVLDMAYYVQQKTHIHVVEKRCNRKGFRNKKSKENVWYIYSKTVGKTKKMLPLST